MINMNHLRVFYICALHKNVTKASQILRVSQPSVSQQIKSFEEEIGIPLFSRAGRSFELTSEGKNLFNKSQSVFDTVGSIEDFIENRSEFSGRVLLNASADIERPFISKVVSDLMKSSIFDNVQFKVNSISNFKKYYINKRPANNVVELFLTHKKTDSLNLINEFSFPVKLISSVDNVDLGQTKTSNLKSLLLRVGQKLVVPSLEHPLRREFESNFRLKDFNTEILLESDIMACLTEAIREGLGCGLLPIQYVYEDIKSKKLSVYGPPNGFWIHKLYLYSASKNQTSVSRELTRIIQKFSIQQGG